MSYTRKSNSNMKSQNDKIYFIAPSPEQIDEDIKTLNELFENHSNFVNEISQYEMKNSYKPNTTTKFISIKLRTTDLNENIFQSMALKINKKINKISRYF